MLTVSVKPEEVRSSFLIETHLKSAFNDFSVTGLMINTILTLFCTVGKEKISERLRL